MAIGITKPWTNLDDADELRPIAPTVGVFELADADGDLLAFGYAGGHSRFGLRSEVPRIASQTEGAAMFRVEVTSNYISRWLELHLVRDQAMKQRN